MKIVFDHQIFSRQRFGGVSRYFTELADELIAIGCDVEVIWPFKGHSTATWALNSLHALARVAPRLDVDIFHETYFSIVDAKPASAKRIVTVHDMLHYKFRDSSPLGRIKTLLRAERLAVKRADHVICVSKNTQKDLCELFGVSMENTSVVYHGAALRTGKKAPPTVERPFILYVGRRRGYKNFARLLEAFASSRQLTADFDLVCFGGEKPNAYETRYRLGKLPLKFLPSAADEVLAGLYAAATLFVYPSLYEGFGIPPLEAMSNGCPVACSNTSSLPEIVGDAAALFDPYDVSHVRSVVEKVAFSPELAASLARRGLEHAAKFSWRRCAEDTLAVYRRALA